MFPLQAIQRGATGSFEHGKVAPDDIPNLFGIDPIVGVTQVVPEPSNIAPRLVWAKALGVRTKPRRRFAETHQATLDCVSGTQIHIELRALHYPDVFPNLPDILDNILKMLDGLR